MDRHDDDPRRGMRIIRGSWGSLLVTRRSVESLALAVEAFALLNVVTAAVEPRLMWVASHDNRFTIAHLADYLRSKRPEGRRWPPTCDRRRV